MQPSSSPELIGLLSTELCNSPQPVVFVLSDNSNAVQVMGAGGAATAVTKTDGALLRTALEHCNREASSASYPEMLPIKFKMLPLEHAFLPKKRRVDDGTRSPDGRPLEHCEIDGLLKTSWIAKHCELVPSVVLLVLPFTQQTTFGAYAAQEERICSAVERTRSKVAQRDGTKLMLVLLKRRSDPDVDITEDLDDEDGANENTHESHEDTGDNGDENSDGDGLAQGGPSTSGSVARASAGSTSPPRGGKQSSGGLPSSPEVFQGKVSELKKRCCLDSKMVVVLSDSDLAAAYSASSPPSSLVIRLHKHTREFAHSYYLTQARRLKKWEKALNKHTQQAFLVRYCFKIGCFYEFQGNTEKMSRYYRAAFEYLSELPRKHRELVARTGEAGGYSWPSQCRGIGELLMFKLCSHALLGYLSNTSGSIGKVGDVEGLPGSGVGGGSGGVDRTSSTTSNSALADEAAVSTLRNHLLLFSDTKAFGTTQAASSGSASPGLTDDASIHCAWLIRQHRIFGILLEQRQKSLGSLGPNGAYGLLNGSSNAMGSVAAKSGFLSPAYFFSAAASLAMKRRRIAADLAAHRKEHPELFALPLSVEENLTSADGGGIRLVAPEFVGDIPQLLASDDGVNDNQSNASAGSQDEVRKRQEPQALASLRWYWKLEMDGLLQDPEAESKQKKQGGVQHLREITALLERATSHVQHVETLTGCGRSRKKAELLVALGNERLAAGNHADALDVLEKAAEVLAAFGPVTGLWAGLSVSVLQKMAACMRALIACDSREREEKRQLRRRLSDICWKLLSKPNRELIGQRTRAALYQEVLDLVADRSGSQSSIVSEPLPQAHVVQGSIKQVLSVRPFFGAIRAEAAATVQLTVRVDSYLPAQLYISRLELKFRDAVVDSVVLENSSATPATLAARNSAAAAAEVVGNSRSDTASSRTNITIVRDNLCVSPNEPLIIVTAITLPDAATVAFSLGGLSAAGSASSMSTRSGGSSSGGSTSSTDGMLWLFCDSATVVAHTSCSDSGSKAVREFAFECPVERAPSAPTPATYSSTALAKLLVEGTARTRTGKGPIARSLGSSRRVGTDESAASVAKSSVNSVSSTPVLCPGVLSSGDVSLLETSPNSFVCYSTASTRLQPSLGYSEVLVHLPRGSLQLFDTKSLYSEGVRSHSNDSGERPPLQKRGHTSKRGKDDRGRGQRKFVNRRALSRREPATCPAWARSSVAMAAAKKRAQAKPELPSSVASAENLLVGVLQPLLLELRLPDPNDDFLDATVALSATVSTGDINSTSASVGNSDSDIRSEFFWTYDGDREGASEAFRPLAIGDDGQPSEQLPLSELKWQDVVITERGLDGDDYFDEDENGKPMPFVEVPLEDNYLTEGAITENSENKAEAQDQQQKKQKSRRRARRAWLPIWLKPRYPGQLRICAEVSYRPRSELVSYFAKSTLEIDATCGNPLAVTVSAASDCCHPCGLSPGHHILDQQSSRGGSSNDIDDVKEKSFATLLASQLATITVRITNTQPLPIVLHLVQTHLRPLADSSSQTDEHQKLLLPLPISNEFAGKDTSAKELNREASITLSEGDSYTAAFSVLTGSGRVLDDEKSFSGLPQPGDAKPIGTIQVHWTRGCENLVKDLPSSISSVSPSPSPPSSLSRYCWKPPASMRESTIGAIHSEFASALSGGEKPASSTSLLATCILDCPYAIAVEPPFDVKLSRPTSASVGEPFVVSWRIRNRTPHFQSLSVHAVLPPPDAVTDFLTTLMEREKIGSINGRENHNASGSKHSGPTGSKGDVSKQAVSFSHKSPDGSWVPYSAAQALHIADAIARNPRGGAITLRVSDSHADAALSAGADSKRRGFEVRWGNEAKSERMPVAPSTGMIQINLASGNTRIVRRGNGSGTSSLVDSASETPSSATLMTDDDADSLLWSGMRRGSVSMEPFGEVTLSYTIVALQTGKLPLPIVDIISERYGTFLINEQATLKQQQQQQRLSTAMLAPIPCIYVVPFQGQLPS